ncbi:AfsR/SARP family transcriptional regulator [Actinomadura spongiicola]|uniref:AfsR/SARP family transcriptional regulator n=1 Tax=Actinomadura spongiicola TaxID=2303421 RepID=A0A372GQ08_9ACTN|nr:BTAD domain-containing putative transcriptional regulator [Actinomadura spongiicola]RFS87454.1 AfsR/SARP family transcriptional regulator [Actinomadura spongiicola]
MRFGVLGPLAVWTSDGRPVKVPGRKTRALLADLLAHEGRPVPAARLIADLWGEEPSGNASAVLQTKVWQLRRALEQAEPGGRDMVVFQGNGYLLRTDHGAVDLGRFAELTGLARGTDDPRGKASLLADALALWRGQAFAGFEDEEFVRATIVRLEEERLAAEEEHAAARLELGEHAAVAGELSELVGRHPLRERLRGLQMRALYRAGRTSEALAQYDDLRARLAEELGLDPGPELTALRQAVLTQDPALDADSAPPRPQTNLPVPVTELVGRDEAVAAVKALLPAARLVTLTGPGGVGKTRLALETAARLVDAYPDGTWLAELAALGDDGHAGASVAEAVMTVLGIREESGPRTASIGPAGPAAPANERLAEAVRDRRLLLVLDSCEHVIDAVADLVSVLLRRAPELRVLATSQESLGISGEAIYPVAPLDVPATASDPAAVERSSAARLFVARAAAASPGFRLDAGNAHDVAVICRRLDGIPLALELAATRVRALGLPGLIARLDDRFRLLARGYRGAPPRQRTLRAMIDWSWELLTGPERAVLRRLAVHAEGCTLGAAEIVCSGGGVRSEDVLALLARLVDRSLVVMADHAGGPRYRLLESVAEYSLARLQEAGESERVRLKHCHYYIELLEDATSHLRGSDQREWLGRLDAEAANVRRALENALHHGKASHALRLCNAAAWYWFLRGRLREAERSFQRALAIEVPPTAASTRARAEAWQAGFAALVGDTVAPWSRINANLPEDTESLRTLWFLGFALFGGGHQAASEEVIGRVLDGFHGLDDRWGVAAALSVRANQAHVRGDLVTLERDGHRSAEIFGELGDLWGRLQTVEPLASLAEMNGDYDRAERLFQEGRRIAEELGMWSQVSDTLSGLGNLAMLAGDHARAREFHQDALRVAAEHSFKPGEIRAEVGLGLGARREGRLDAAETHLRHVLEWLTRLNFEPGRALVLAELGFIAELRGDAATSLRLHLEGWAAARNTGDARAMALALEGLAGAHTLAARHTSAALLLGAAAAARDSVNMPLPPAERGDVDRITRTVREHLDEDTYRTTFEHGRTIQLDESTLGG